MVTFIIGPGQEPPPYIGQWIRTVPIADIPPEIRADLGLPEYPGGPQFELVLENPWGFHSQEPEERGWDIKAVGILIGITASYFLGGAPWWLRYPIELGYTFGRAGLEYEGGEFQFDTDDPWFGAPMAGFDAGLAIGTVVRVAQPALEAAEEAVAWYDWAVEQSEVVGQAFDVITDPGNIWKVISFPY